MAKRRKKKHSIELVQTEQINTDDSIIKKHREMIKKIISDILNSKIEDQHEVEQGFGTFILRIFIYAPIFFPLSAW